METKQCKGPCGQKKKLSEFHKHKPAKDGLKPRCKECRKKSCTEKLNKKCEMCGVDFEPARSTRMYCSESCRTKARYRDHKDEMLFVNQQYYKTNTEKVLKKCYEYYYNNRESRLKQQSEYGQTDHGRAMKLANTNKRRAKKLSATMAGYDDSLKEIYIDCPEGYQVDHIVPLTNSKVCGLHVPWNLQILPKTLNLKKSNKFDGTTENNSWREELG